MAKMTFGSQRITLSAYGKVSISATDEKADAVVVGQVMRDGKKWVARLADKTGKLASKKTEHPTRQAAFEALLAAHEVKTPTAS